MSPFNPVRELIKKKVLKCRYFTGLVDEVQIFTAVADESNVAELFAGGSGGR